MPPVPGYDAAYHAIPPRSIIASPAPPPDPGSGWISESLTSDGPDSFEPDISVAATRIAVIGFGASVFFLALVALIVVLEAGGQGGSKTLYGISLVALLLGLFLSFAGLSKRHRISRQHHRLAIAGLVISMVSITALPFLLIVAFAMFRGDFFT